MDDIHASVSVSVNLLWLDSTTSAKLRGLEKEIHENKC